MFSTGKTLPKKLYIIGVVVIFAVIYSQYFISMKGAVVLLVVYGIPVVVTSLFFGRELLRRAGKNNKTAFKFGLGLFGTLNVIGYALSFIALLIITVLSPQTLDLLNRLNPALDVSSNLAWIMIIISFLIVGPAEEYLFRGFIYGGLLNLSKGKHGLPLAVASSLLFSFIHAYYAVTYEVASAVYFIQLFTFGLAMAVTYYWSDGNLLVPTLIHGAYDAIGFLGVALNDLTIALVLRIALMVIGVVFAVVYLPQKIPMLRLTPEKKPKPAPPPPPP
jgi:membrane protease YdiL (CAAX protease family)